MKQILDRAPNKEAASNTWNDLRAAYWMRLVQDKKGDMFTPGVMLNNIKNALASQRSVVGVLYSKEELAQIRNFQKGLETITYKDPNPSGSGVAAASFARQFLGNILEALGLRSHLAQAALAYSGIQRATGTAAAKSATSQAPARVLQPPLAPLGSAAGALYDQNRSD